MIDWKREERCGDSCLFIGDGSVGGVGYCLFSLLLNRIYVFIYSSSSDRSIEIASIYHILCLGIDG